MNVQSDQGFAVPKLRGQLADQFAEVASRESTRSSRRPRTLVVAFGVLLALPATVALAGGFDRSEPAVVHFDGNTVNYGGKIYHCPLQVRIEAEARDPDSPCSMWLPADPPRSVQGDEAPRSRNQPTLEDLK